MKPKSPDAARVRRLVAALDRFIPEPRCELDYETPFQLIIAVILSAQCTDQRVNLVTPVLFARYPTPRALADARQEDVEEVVRSTGFFRNKARAIIGTSRAIAEDFGDEVPADMDALLTLPGVARKTANLVLGECFGVAEGIVVDTHVGRLSQLLGLTSEKDPKKVERDLMERIPQSHWIRFAHQLILHGRATCVARRPRCTECFLSADCPSSEL